MILVIQMGAHHTMEDLAKTILKSVNYEENQVSAFYLDNVAFSKAKDKALMSCKLFHLYGEWFTPFILNKITTYYDFISFFLILFSIMSLFPLFLYRFLRLFWVILFF